MHRTFSATRTRSSLFALVAEWTPREILVRIVSLPAEIRIHDLENTKQAH